VAAMIRGVLYHDTMMDLDKISVDTHGQSSIGFAFGELLSFDLLPRIKDINKQKLYASSNRLKKTYKNLTDALASEVIHWVSVCRTTSYIGLG
jgi:TnpA family transposase